MHEPKKLKKFEQKREHLNSHVSESRRTSNLDFFFQIKYLSFHPCGCFGKRNIGTEARIVKGPNMRSLHHQAPMNWGSLGDNPSKAESRGIVDKYAPNAIPII